MRYVTILVLLAGIGGCAGSRPNPNPTTALASARYIDSPSAALVFTPPAALYGPPVLLPREERYPSAFVGFEETTTTFSYIRSNDRQGQNGGDCLFREAISEKIGVSYR
jgi:hypothetical protein